MEEIDHMRYEELTYSFFVSPVQYGIWSFPNKKTPSPAAFPQKTVFLVRRQGLEPWTP